MRELMLKKCNSCGSLIKVIKDCHCPCNFICCDEKMREVKPNTVEASFEKHIPTFEVVGDNLNVKVNHVMEDNHYIEWISFVTETSEYLKYFKPGDTPEAIFPNEKGILYAYCNMHELWSIEVK